MAQFTQVILIAINAYFAASNRGHSPHEAVIRHQAEEGDKRPPVSCTSEQPTGFLPPPSRSASPGGLFWPAFAVPSTWLAACPRCSGSPPSMPRSPPPSVAVHPVCYPDHHYPSPSTLVRRVGAQAGGCLEERAGGSASPAGGGLLAAALYVASLSACLVADRFTNAVLFAPGRTSTVSERR